MAELQRVKFTKDYLSSIVEALKTRDDVTVPAAIMCDYAPELTMKEIINFWMYAYAFLANHNRMNDALLYGELVKQAMRKKSILELAPMAGTIGRAYRLVVDAKVEDRPMPYVDAFIKPWANFLFTYRELFKEERVWLEWVIECLDPVFHYYAEAMEGFLLKEGEKEILLNKIKKGDTTTTPDIDKMKEQLRVDIASIETRLLRQNNLLLSQFIASDRLLLLLGISVNVNK